MWLVYTLIILSVLYLLAIRGRSGHPGLQNLRGWYYAHRGLHGQGRPENSMAAFRAALEGGYGIEFDVHLMKDGNLAVIHDSSLKRTAGADVMIEDLTVADLENYRLEGTNEKIPLLRELLDLYAGKAPLIVELKCERNNFSALCRAACAMLDTYDGPYCMESFDPRCVLWLKKHRPDIIRGQLAENWLKVKSMKLPWILKLILTCHLGNFLLMPDFTAYKYADRKVFGTDLCRKLWNVQGVSWTIRTKEDFDIAVKEGWLPIFEGFIP
jgi:glycerophosphoryl diester phosphodiesterase